MRNCKLIKVSFFIILTLLGFLIFNNIVNPTKALSPLFYIKGHTYLITNEPAKNSDIIKEVGIILKKTKNKWDLPKANGESNILPIGTKIYSATNTELVNSSNYNGFIVQMDNGLKMARPFYFNNRNFENGLLINKFILGIIIATIGYMIYSSLKKGKS